MKQVEWPQDREEIDDPERENELLRELRRETGDPNPNHPLNGKNCRVIGWRRTTGKDFVLHLPDEGRFAFVHLTWHRETNAGYPYCEILEDVETLNESLRDD